MKSFTRFVTAKTKIALIGIAIMSLLLLVFTVIKKPILASEVIAREEFTTIHGESISLVAWRGKPIVVAFWATDCPSCIQEIPSLLSLYRDYHAKGLEIIAVAMAYDPPSRVVAVTNAMQIPYHVALDLDSRHARAFGNIKFTPATFLIDRKGKVVAKSIGFFDRATWSRLIANILSEG